MKNIVLVGFMGTGKTVVAKAVAERLKMRYMDLDNIIEEKEQRPITEIFAQEGHAHFRKVEKAVVRDISAESGQVIATGGGVVIDAENVTNLKRNGIMVCLTASPEVILKRTAQKKHRPLLNVKDPVARIKELLSFRTPFYALADHTINTSNLTINEVTDRAIKLLFPKRGRKLMGKPRDTKKDTKKKAQKSIKEKRLAKKAKKTARSA